MPYQKEFKDIQSVTGIKEISAAATIAEIGVDMSRFPDEAHISSWAGVVSLKQLRAQERKRAEKRGEVITTSKRPKPGAAGAASRTKDTTFSAMYRNIAGRRGKKRALVAVGHQILIEVCRVLKTGDQYQDAGAAAVTERRLQNREQRMIRELKRCGYDVSKVVA